MFLTIKEMKHNKLRYSMIIAVVALISYLIFILTSLAYGLAQENRQAVDSWRAANIVLNSDANGVLASSTLTKQQSAKIKVTGNASKLGELAVAVKKIHGQGKTSAELLGVSTDQFIYRELKITQGKKFTKNNEAVVDEGLRTAGYKIGDAIKVVAHGPKVKIVGFTKNAKMSVAPVIYTSLATWRQIKYGAQKDGQLSALVVKNGTVSSRPAGTQKLTIADFINQLPGYTAQNMTFEFMIGFLLIITMIIITIFLYILTIQKLPLFATLKIQGVLTGYLIKNTVGQAGVITLTGLVIGGILALVTQLVMPAAVPMTFSYPLLAGAAGLLLVMALLGSLIPVRTIKKVDPAIMIGGY